MDPTTLWINQVLSTPFPSYHAPLEFARTLGRENKRDERLLAIELLGGLTKRYPYALAIWQEFVFILIEENESDRAERTLKQLAGDFANLDEETLCRWGRLFKDRGDQSAQLARSSSSNGDLDHAERYYRRSLEKYDQAYRVREGHYPGINKATLLLVVGSLKTSPAIDDLRKSTDLAEAILASRSRWTPEQPDDEEVWFPATEGEAHLLCQDWIKAAGLYRLVLQQKNLKGFARTSIRRQVERIVACFKTLGIEPPPPFDHPEVFFQTASE